jgi:hypothetical protein
MVLVGLGYIFSSINFGSVFQNSKLKSTTKKHAKLLLQIRKGFPQDSSSGAKLQKQTRINQEDRG